MSLVGRKILIVEDERAIADNLIFALEKEGALPLRVPNIEQAKSEMQKTSFDGMILDVGLPDGNGFDFCKEVRKTNDLPILFLTARNDEIDKIVGFEIGADDYVTKPFSPREVIARLQAIFRRSDSPKHEGSSAFQIDEKKHRILYRGIPLELGRYEFGVLCLLAKSPGQVFSRQQIMESVWETPDMSLERTVDTHIKTIRHKLSDVDPDQQDLITHRGVGYSVKD